MKKLLSQFLLVVLIMFVTTPIMKVNAANTNVAGTIYYVDSAAGNDSNNGTSTSTPWQTLSKVNSITFQPGDQILFKAGGSWVGTLQPLGSGSIGSPITIDMYGTGDKPLIAGNGATAGVMLNGQEYWTINNLHVTNHSSTLALRHGIYVYGKATGITHSIHITNCEVNDVSGVNDRTLPTQQNMYYNSAIYISMPGESTAANHLDDILVQGNNIHDVTCSGIRVTQQDDFIIDIYHTNVVIKNNTIRNTGTDGMIISNSVSPLIEHNSGYDLGVNGVANTRCIAGFWSAGASNPVFQYNEVARTVLFDHDGTAFDADWGMRGTPTFQYNYTHGNQGGVLLDCEDIKPDPGFVNNIYRYNVSVNDFGFTVRHGSNATEVYNNVFYKSSGSLNDSSTVAGKHNFYNNIFNFTTTPNWGTSTYENNCYYPIANNSTDTNAVTGNPEFVNAGAMGDGMSYADNYKIGSSSSCIDKGMSISNNGGQDFWGNSLYNGAPDIGANEYSSASSSYTFSSGYSSTQGLNNWYYMEYNGNTYTNMTWNSSTNRWNGTYKYNLIWSPTLLHPDVNDTVIAWKAPIAGTVRITGNPRKNDIAGGDGVNVKIMKGNTELWPASGWQFIAANDATGVTHDVTVSVAANDMIYFILDKNLNNAHDATTWDPTIAYQ
jgi:hypothetical protein